MQSLRGLFVASLHKPAVEQTVMVKVIWYALTRMWRRRNNHFAWYTNTKSNLPMPWNTFSFLNM